MGGDMKKLSDRRNLIKEDTKHFPMNFFSFLLSSIRQAGKQTRKGRIVRDSFLLHSSKSKSVYECAHAYVCLCLCTCVERKERTNRQTDRTISFSSSCMSYVCPHARFVVRVLVSACRNLAFFPALCSTFAFDIRNKS